MTLAETQAFFHAALTGDVTLDAPVVDRVFLGTTELAATERVAIYRAMYVARITDALRETFPNVARLVGVERFAALAERYLAEHGSDHHDIGRIGRRLPEFLRTYPDPDRRDLADLATLEWARNEAFFAPACPIAVPRALAAAGPEQVGATRLRIAASLRLLELASDAAAAWKEKESGEVPEPPVVRPTAVVVWRRQLEVLHCVVPAREAAALQAAMEGEALDSICAAFAAADDPAGEARAALASWFHEGWIAAVAVAPPAQDRSAPGH